MMGCYLMNEDKIMRLGVLGTGTIATAVVHGIAGDINGDGLYHQITISPRNKANAEALAAQYDNVTIAENQQVIEASDVIFLGLMPDVARAILPELNFKDGQIVISFIADLTLDDVGGMVAPAEAKALMLPFPNIAHGNSVIPMIGDEAMVAEIFAPKNSLTVLKDQDEMNAILCAQAVLSPAVKMVKDAAIWLEENGVEMARGEPFLRMLVASNLTQTATPELLDALNTEGGYNQRLRMHMDKEGMPQMLSAGLDGLKS